MADLSVAAMAGSSAARKAEAMAETMAALKAERKVAPWVALTVDWRAEQ